MPYISFKTNHKLTLRQENTIKSKSGGDSFHLFLVKQKKL